MHIVVDAQPDPARYAAAFRYILRGAFRRVRVLGGIFALLGILLIVVSADGWPPGVALVVIGGLFALVVPGNSIRASVRNLPLALRQPQRIEVTDQTVRVASPLLSTEYAWGAFVKTDEIPGQVLLMVSKRQVVPVPVDAVPAAQLAELREFLANRAFLRQ